MKVHIKTSYDIFHVHTQDHDLDHTVAQIKEEISRTYKGKPPFEAVELLCAGKVLKNTDIIKSICGKTDEISLTLILTGGRKEAKAYGMQMTLDGLRNRERKCDSDPIGEAINRQMTFLAQDGITKFLGELAKKGAITAATITKKGSSPYGFRCPHHDPGRVRFIAAAYQPQIQHVNGAPPMHVPGPNAPQVNVPVPAQQEGAANEQQRPALFGWADAFNISLLFRLCLVVALFLGSRPSVTRCVIIIGSAFLFYLYQVGALNFILPSLEANPPVEEAMAPLTKRELCERFVIGFFASLNPAWAHTRRVEPVRPPPEVAEVDQVG